MQHHLLGCLLRHLPTKISLSMLSCQSMYAYTQWTKPPEWHV